MEFAKLLEQHLQESASIIKRRTNMLGQHLSNIGFEDVEVTVHIETKVRDPHGSGISVQKIEGTYKKYTPGFGPSAIKGNGSAEDVDGFIPSPQTAPTAQQIQQPPSRQAVQPSQWNASPQPSSILRGSQRPSAFPNNNNDD